MNKCFKCFVSVWCSVDKKLVISTQIKTTPDSVVPVVTRFFRRRQLMLGSVPCLKTSPYWISPLQRADIEVVHYFLHLVDRLASPKPGVTDLVTAVDDFWESVESVEGARMGKAIVAWLELFTEWLDLVCQHDMTQDLDRGRMIQLFWKLLESLPVEDLIADSLLVDPWPASYRVFISDDSKQVFDPQIIIPQLE